MSCNPEGPQRAGGRTDLRSETLTHFSLLIYDSPGVTQSAALPSSSCEHKGKTSPCKTANIPSATKVQSLLQNFHQDQGDLSYRDSMQCQESRETAPARHELSCDLSRGYQPELC